MPTRIPANHISISGDSTVDRRAFIRGSTAVVALNTGLGRAFAETLSQPAENMVAIENFSAAGIPLGAVRTPKIVKTDAEWRRQLSALAFDVTRRAGTEAPFSGAYSSSHADGLYRCICCNTALYDSRTKFESGTGWPSFWQPIAALNVVATTDRSLFMTRTAIACRLCDAHIGHVFDDGPKPTGLRYCMNSVALTFAARA
jgi:peptide-methionine (R)-S-oxide reductase